MKLRPRRKESPNPNITPLIDVVFLLLIFFMVSTTFDKQTKLKVDLPEASAEILPDERRENIAITIDAKGHFYVNDEELITHDVETLRRTLQKISDGHKDLPIVITGDRSAPYQAALTVMDAASQLGMQSVSFVAQYNGELAN